MSLPAAWPPSLPAQVWRADSLAGTERDMAAATSTGFAALDAELPGGGWPAAGLIELLQEAPGHGELRLLAPLLAATTAPLLWVAPPLAPYAPALQAVGLKPERLALVEAERAADAAWAAEQALRTGALAAVLWWPATPATATPLLRRLHLAAQEGHTPLFAFRHLSVRTLSSPSPLRLAIHLQPPGPLVVDVFKRRGPPLAAPLLLDLPAPLQCRRRRTAATRPEPKDPRLVVVGTAPERIAA